MQKVTSEVFANLAHRKKQATLAKLPVEDGRGLLYQLYGHEYDPFIFGLIPTYCTSPFLEAGGESQHIVEAGNTGLLTGMQRVAADPFSNYTSGSPLVIKAEILSSTETLCRAVIRYGWEEKQKQELRYPSVSLDGLVQTPDGEYVSPHELVADPTEVGDPFEEMLLMDAWRSALSKLSPDERGIVLAVLAGKDLSTIAHERGQKYVTIQVAYWRARKTFREELSTSWIASSAAIGTCITPSTSSIRRASPLGP